MEFRLREKLKDERFWYMNWRRGSTFLGFWSSRKDKILDWPWVVNGQVVMVEPWQPGFLISEGTIFFGSYLDMIAIIAYAILG